MTLTKYFTFYTLASALVSEVVILLCVVTTRIEIGCLLARCLAYDTCSTHIIYDIQITIAHIIGYPSVVSVVPFVLSKYSSKRNRKKITK